MYTSRWKVVAYGNAGFPEKNNLPVPCICVKGQERKKKLFEHMINVLCPCEKWEDKSHNLKD